MPDRGKQWQDYFDWARRPTLRDAIDSLTEDGFDRVDRKGKPIENRWSPKYLGDKPNREKK